MMEANNQSDRILKDLNDSQKKAVTFNGKHALVLAGAGCGKTKTIIARAAYLIANGIKPERIKILTFTRKAASEIVNRIKSFFGNSVVNLDASTFHKWCATIIHTNPKMFGYTTLTCIDRDDQLQIFKLLRGKKIKGSFPSTAELCELYSYARNTKKKLSDSIKVKLPHFIDTKNEITEIMRAYEAHKEERNYLDYDDILDIVATGMNSDDKICKAISSKYDYILVDEMQDTNPLQWSLLEPLSQNCKLFCVGDDAQAIYGFRGADFNNVHSFDKRINNTTVLKLEDNYRSTQEILDVSNWLLTQSPIKYDKKLNAVRGSGKLPELHTFHNEWDEANWISEKLLTSYNEGYAWKNNMILIRSVYDLRALETSLIEKQIPYTLIGGQKLFEAAHIKDFLSLFRIINNYKDEISWMRYLELWNGIGDRTATEITNRIINEANIIDGFNKLKNFKNTAFMTPIIFILNAKTQLPELISTAYENMKEILHDKYRNDEWEKREKDFIFIKNLSKKYSSLNDFLSDYILDPIYISERDVLSSEDYVTISTIHSAKGTECESCYILNASIKNYPSTYSIGNIDEIEEDRRVLYVALTRAKNNLILTRRNFISWSYDKNITDDDKSIAEMYFLNKLPANLVVSEIHVNDDEIDYTIKIERKSKIKVGINLD